jgi:cytochrome c551/c552
MNVTAGRFKNVIISGSPFLPRGSFDMPMARRCLVLAVIIAFSPAGLAADIDPEQLRPGLIATFRDGAGRELTRLEPLIALNLGKDEAPHPRLAAGGEAIRWEGYLNLQQGGDYRFSAVLRGNFQLLVDGREVLAGNVGGNEAGSIDAESVRLTPGVHSLAAEYKRAGGPARLELFWQSKSFHREPVPFDAFFHLPKERPTRIQEALAEERGRFLVEEHACAACHRPDAGDALGRGLHVRRGPVLSDIGRRAYAGWIDRWLDDPQKLQPDSVMPKLFADDDAGRVERYAVTCYLASLGGPLQPEFSLKYSPGGGDRGRSHFVSVGCAACHPGGAGKSADQEGASSSGRAVYSLGDLRAKTTSRELIRFLINPLAVNPSGRMPDMKLSRTEAEEIARYLCPPIGASADSALPRAPSAERLFEAWKRLPPTADSDATFQKLPAEARWRGLGRRLVSAKGCLNCHTLVESGPEQPAYPAKETLADIRRANGTGGCLADSGRSHGMSPRFALTADDRAAIKQFLKSGLDGAGSPAPAYAARAAIQRFDCLNCHERDGRGGLPANLVELMRKFEKVENAEGLLPPPLTGAGHKLRAPWLEQVLIRSGRARPWLSLRMPQFGEANVGFLSTALAALEGAMADSTVYQAPVTNGRIEAGKTLLGKSGLGCISCHDYAGGANTGTRGPDLITMNQRVRYDWYRRWLEQPQKMQPGTRMPQVFPDGKSVLPTVLDGHADAQAEAMWAYAALGSTLALPEGLSPPRGLVLSVKDKPQLLRTFMPEAGARAIAVGYPGGVSVAFDAAKCRLAYAWSGNFLDVSPVWNNRGGAPALLLGQRFWSAPPGFPWAHGKRADFLERIADSEFGAALPEGKVFAGPRRVFFDGYGTSDKGEPIFRYHFQGDAGPIVSVSEQPAPLRKTLAVGVRRRFTVLAPDGAPLVFWAGQSSQKPRVYEIPERELSADSAEHPAAGVILPQDGGRIAVLKRVNAPNGTAWEFRQEGAVWLALLHLKGKGSTAVSFAVDVWVLPKDDRTLLKDLESP